MCPAEARNALYEDWACSKNLKTRDNDITRGMQEESSDSKGGKIGRKM